MRKGVDDEIVGGDEDECAGRYRDFRFLLRGGHTSMVMAWASSVFVFFWAVFESPAESRLDAAWSDAS
jgi:hypothetical protein